MRNSGGGVQQVGRVVEAVTSRPQPIAVGKPKRPAKARRSNLRFELALRKEKASGGWSCSIAPPPPPATRSSTQIPAPSSATERDRWSATGDSAPASARSTLLTFRRHWHCHWRCELPCWLVSLLLHLLAVVTLGSLTIPVGQHRSVVLMLITFGEAGTSADNAPVELTATASLAPIDEPPDWSATDSATEPAEDLRAQQPVLDIAMLPQGPIDPPKAQPVREKAGAAWNAEALHHPAAADDGDKSRLPEEIDEVHDEVVDKFVEFDVGRLKGAPGAKARHDFNRLGPEAIRSLVRGLNKSASIHASCPVVVIAGKIEALLRDHEDPSLLRYALDNIGRDVPADAPHFSHLQGLLARLKQSEMDRSSPNVRMLASLKAPHERPRVLAGIRSAVGAWGTLSDEEKLAVARQLVGLLTHRDSQLRRAAHDALVTMADGKDCGPANDRHSADRLAAAREWSRHFDPDGYQEAAQAVLDNAQHLADAGKRGAARKQLHKLLREYPDSTAAGMAADQLDALKLSAIK